jgi:predicted Fe-Mo cluster-binding NifX family protein
MNILISIEDNNYLYSKVSKKFGLSNFFALYNTKTKRLNISYNSIFNSYNKLPIDNIIKTYNPQSIFSLEIGKKTIDLFKNKNIKVKKGNYTTLQQIIENIENLKDL